MVSCATYQDVYRTHDRSYYGSRTEQKTTSACAGGFLYLASYRSGREGSGGAVAIGS